MIQVEGHSDSTYSGLYWIEDEWNDQPMLMNENGAHMYWFPSSGESGYWQFDERD